MSYSEVEQKIIDFARLQDTIRCVTLGHNPDEPQLRTYYFIINSGYDRERVDAISRLELDLYNGSNAAFFCLAEWPSLSIEGYPFLGKPIWIRTLS